jgi:hypothetical protein
MLASLGDELARTKPRHFFPHCQVCEAVFVSGAPHLPAELRALGGGAHTPSSAHDPHLVLRVLSTWVATDLPAGSAACATLRQIAAALAERRDSGDGGSGDGGWGTAGARLGGGRAGSSPAGSLSHQVLPGAAVARGRQGRGGATYGKRMCFSV